MAHPAPTLPDATAHAHTSAPITIGDRERAHSRLRQAVRRAQHGWPAGFPIVQFPNAAASAACAGWLAAALTEGSTHAHARAVFHVSLSAWGWLEATSGVNWFRRGLGIAGLAYVVVELSKELERRT